MIAHSRFSALPLLPVLLSGLLISCGGGGDDVSPSAGGPGAAGCAPTRTGYDAVAIGGTEAAAVAAMGCTARLINQVTVEGAAQTNHDWGTAGTGPYVQVRVSGGRVTAKTAQSLDGASTPATCLPTSGSFGALQIGADRASAFATVGCTGGLVAEVSVQGLTELSYAWGDVASGPYALVKFGNGVMTAKLSQRLTPASAASVCVPTRVTYDSIAVGQDLATVQQRMGCAGQKLNDVIVAGLARQTYAWGDVATGPYAQITFDGGVVSGKLGTRIDAAAPANCTPTQARFNALAAGSSLATAQATMGCAGELVNELTVGGVRQVSQSWGSVVSGPYVMVKLEANLLTSKLAQRLDGTGTPSTCAPTSASHAALAIGMTVAQAEAAVGCAGQLVTEIVVGSANEKSFAWGDVVTGPYQMVKFNNGTLVAKLGMRL